MHELALDDGCTLAWEEWGDSEAPAVVLLHGFTADHRMWKAHAEALAEDYRVLAPDLRGHGESGAPEDLDSYTMDRYAEDIRQLLVGAGIDICALVGCSFGGMIALHTAVNFPELVAALVASDASPAYDSHRYAEEFRERERGMREMEDIVAKFGTVELGKRMAKRIDDEFLAEGMRRRMSAMRREGYLGAARVRRTRPDLIPRLAGLPMPVLICTGDEDPVRSAADVMHEELPGARLVTFRGAGHGVPTLRPETFYDVLAAFFRDVEDGKPIGARSTV